MDEDASVNKFYPGEETDGGKTQGQEECAGSDIRLDPDVLEGGGASRTSLGGLYELSVFAPGTRQRAEELRAKEQQRLRQIRRKIFDREGETEEEARLADIRGRIFETVYEPAVLEAAASENAVLEEAISEKAGRREPVRETGPFIGMAAAGCMILVLGIERLRRKASHGRK